MKTSGGMTVERWQHNQGNRVPTQLFVTDIADDSDATGSNGGTNEGDYNAFFAADGFFTGANMKTDFDQDGDADTADYNRFMDTYFEAPAQGRAAGSVFKTVYLAAGQMYDDTLSGPTDPATVTLTARSRWVGEGSLCSAFIAANHGSSLLSRHEQCLLLKQEFEGGGGLDFRYWPRIFRALQCPIPQIVCDPSCGSTGHTNCNGSFGGSTIRICTGDNTGTETVADVLRHELVHALDCCTGHLGPNREAICEDVICSEARAYACQFAGRGEDKRCIDGNGDWKVEQCIFPGVERSICAGRESSPCCRAIRANRSAAIAIATRCAKAVIPNRLCLGVKPLQREDLVPIPKLPVPADPFDVPFVLRTADATPFVYQSTSGNCGGSCR